MTDDLSRIAAALAGRYRIDRELGQGGTAVVYLAQDLKHQRQVALKVLRPDVAATVGLDRFQREIEIAARLQHPHVLPLYDSGEAGGFLYYVMPYVEGPTLRTRLLKEGGELPIPEVVRILRDVVDAVAAAHAIGVVHRDLKPENIMLSGRHALVADFGVAKALSEAKGEQRLTTAGVALGTPAYMAPEQAAGEAQTDHRADIYALGVVGYEMLTGDPPFMRSNPRALLAAQVTEAPVPVTERRETVPPALAALVMRCLAKKPADRPQSAPELVPVLESLLTPSGGMTPVTTLPLQPERAAREHRLRPVVVAAVTLVLLLAILGGVKRFVLPPALPDGSVREPIVVLPFTVRGSDPELQAIGADVADQIAAAIEGNQVGAAVTYQGRAAGREFTRRMGARALRATGGGTLVTGVIAKRGDRLAMEARLVRGSDLGIIWTLGPEHGSASDPAPALERLRERVLGAAHWYLSRWGGRVHDPTAYRPPPTLAIAELMEAAAEPMELGNAATGAVTAIPLLRQAYAQDTTWLGALPWLLRAYDVTLQAFPADTVRRLLIARRGRLTEAEAAMVEYVPATMRAPEEEVRAARKLFATDSPYWAFSALQSHVMTLRPKDALRYFALRDTTLDPTAGGCADPWCLPASAAGVAHHLLGEFDKELSLVQAARRKNPSATALWMQEAGALAALGRTRAVDQLVTESNQLEDRYAQIKLLQRAATELADHGRQADARVFAERLLAALDRLPEPTRSSPSPTLRRWEALRILGRLADLRQSVELAVRQRPLSPRMPEGILLPNTWVLQKRVLVGDTAGAVTFVDSARAALGRWPDTSRPRLPFERYQAGRIEFHLAAVLAHLGRQPDAVDLLKSALNNGYRFEADDRISWLFAPLKDYPPFQELVKLR